jgi:hypothetical protein
MKAIIGNDGREELLQRIGRGRCRLPCSHSLDSCDSDDNIFIREHVEECR